METFIFPGQGSESFERPCWIRATKVSKAPQHFQEPPEADPTELPTVGQAWVQEQIKESAVWARDPLEHPLVQAATAKIVQQFQGTVLSGKYLPNPPVRGPHGLAEIWVREGAEPVAKRAYQMMGSRGEIHKHPRLRGQRQNDPRGHFVEFAVVPCAES